VAQADLKAVILLPHLSLCWDYRCTYSAQCQVAVS
jgi:hypothetical protein